MMNNNKNSEQKKETTTTTTNMNELKQAMKDFVQELTKEPCVGLRHVSANVQKRVPQLIERMTDLERERRVCENAYEYDSMYVLNDVQRIVPTRSDDDDDDAPINKTEKLSNAIEECIIQLTLLSSSKTTTTATKKNDSSSSSSSSSKNDDDDNG
jgi:hypothetical protein